MDTVVEGVLTVFIILSMGSISEVTLLEINGGVLWTYKE